VATLTAVLVVAGTLAVAPAQAHHLGIEETLGMPDCDSDLGDPEPGTPEWDEAHRNTVECRRERPTHTLSNPAYWAAFGSNAAASDRVWGMGDPFRDTTVRWAGQRGEYEQFTWLVNDQSIPGVPLQHRAALFRPTDVGDGPLPGIIWNCHSCFPHPIDNAGWEQHVWAAQVISEHGYLVLMADIGGNSTDRATQAIDFFLSTPDQPMPADFAGDHPFNPWHDLLDRERLGIISHSGGAAVSMNVGNRDPRVDAVVAFDRAGSFDPSTVTPTTPTMVQLADFGGDEPPEAKPTWEAGSKYADFEAFAAAGVDAMQVVLRSATHVDWLGASCAQPAAALQYGGCTLDGEQVAAYYMLAWFDRYVRGISDAQAAADALARLTATDTFDGSSDAYSIGTGSFDAAQAAAGGSVEAGNVPVTLEGRSIRNRLSFWYPSRYFLDGGARQCADLRAGCPS
jgi:hypothetical protein